MGRKMTLQELDKCDLFTLVQKLDDQFINNKKIYYPYIEYIRFPHYKIIKENTTITFTYPLTVLVGANGTNKTSVLQALYGCPSGNSIGDYWFTTEVDKITENETKKNCVVYGYYHLGAKKTVEAVKSRINKKDNPDYWEPSRPIAWAGMKTPTPKELKAAGNHSETRWDQITKPFIFADCKKYISSFDLFFYHGNFQKSATMNSKQDFLRKRAKLLSAVTQNNANKVFFRKHNRINSVNRISKPTLEYINWIMNKNYTDIQIITHTLYNHSIYDNAPSQTVFMKCTDSLSYSEAFAGSGEARLILLINDLMSAQPKSLVLIDEPEISIHPEALEKLKKLLLYLACEYKHQIVISTHSASMIRELPNKAIKTFESQNNEIHIHENISYMDAFSTIGQKLDGKRSIFVEDRLGKAILCEYLTRRHDKHWKSSFGIEFIPGGAESIIKDLIMSTSKTGLDDIYYVLDGDKDKYPYSDSYIKLEWCNSEIKKVDVDKIPSSENDHLAQIIQDVTGVDVKLSPSGHSGVPNSEELIDLQRNFLRYWRDSVFFFNSTTPEIAILESLGITLSHQDGKLYYRKLATEKLPESSDIGSNEIFTIQKMDIKKLNDDCCIFSHLDTISVLS